MVWTILLIIFAAVLAAAMLLWVFAERWRLLRRSTWEAMRACGLREILSFRALHAYVYGRWTNQYIRFLIRHVFPRLSPHRGKCLTDHFHGKVLTLAQAEAIITLDRDIPLQDLEQIIPYPAARNMVLTGPPDVAVYECPCRHARDHPCRPTQVCMVVGQPFVDFVLEHNPDSSRRLNQSEALELLRAEHERGHVHIAWFRDIMLDRFYAICNCCKCCCAGIEAMLKYGVQIFASSGYLAEINETYCTGCGTGQDICPFSAITVDGTAVVDRDKCMGCGVCVEKCPEQASSLVRDETKGVPLDVRAIGRQQGT